MSLLIRLVSSSEMCVVVGLTDSTYRFSSIDFLRGKMRKKRRKLTRQKSRKPTMKMKMTLGRAKTGPKERA